MDTQNQDNRIKNTIEDDNRNTELEPLHTKYVKILNIENVAILITAGPTRRKQHFQLLL